MTAPNIQELAAELAPLIVEHLRPNALLNSEQAGALLNVPKSWLLAEARAQRVPHRRLGRYVRFDADELLAWCDGHSAGPPMRAA